MPDYSILSQSPVFKGLPPEAIERLLAGAVFQIRRFQKNELVVSKGEPVKNLCIIHSGSVSGEMLDYSGKVLKIEDIEAPNPLATAFLFGKSNVFPVSVTANTEVEILVIPTSEFLTMMQKDRQVLVNFLNVISSRAQFLSDKLHLLSFRNIRSKLAHFLLKTAPSGEQVVEVRQTQKQLADLFGVTRPSLARVLSEMHHENIIRLEKKSIRILNRQLLIQLLHQD